MICPTCATENKPGRKFCSSCGAGLATACPSCGAATEPGERFCGECGTPLPGFGATQSPWVSVAPSNVTPAGFPDATGEPVAERRLVSVMFTDLVGFTPFAEERDSEDVRETLTRYFDLATEVIERYGGTVEKFIGDAVMAVWGTPIAHEDDAERSVRAALDLVDAVRSVGPGINARAGVLTGEAAVTLGATNQGLVAGDLVNTAARIQSVAQPGTVLVGESTQRAAASAIAFEEAGAETLKGKTAPVPVWRALRVVAERGGRRRADTLEAPFVGRDDELRLIKDLFHATVREGRTRLVSITGIGGIGKSRLTWEFEKYLDGLIVPLWWHRGRSPAYGEGITFWALSEMVRGRAELTEADDERTTRQKIDELLDHLDLEEAERRWIEPALLQLLGVETGIASDQLFGAWRTFFERLAAINPVVMVFEDLHWADSGTLDFIDHLLEWSRAIPLYVVTLARPELLDRRPDWGAGRRNFTSLYLEPLSESAMRELLAGLVPGLPETAIRAVVGRADGIPLYAVETVRMLVADGRLTVTADGTYAPSGDLASLAVPETLTALIAARLDALDPDDRSLILDAAVLGQSFAPGALAAVAGIDEVTLEPRLRGLVRRELLAHETDPRSPERGQYAFVQALIREVAYNTLAKRDRKTRHLAAARFFERLGTDEMAAALAGHYLAARENAPEGPEADALGAQARVALRAAAERAAALGANEQALTLLEQTLSVTTDSADRADLLERAGEAASQAGHHEAAERHLRAAIDTRRELHDRIGVAKATAILGQSMNNAYRPTEAIALLEPATAEFADLADDPGVIAAAGQLARGHFLADDNQRAIEAADGVLESAEHADLSAIVADTLVTKGTALANLGRPTEGLALILAGAALAESIGAGVTQVRAANNASIVEALRDPRAALETARRGILVAGRLGARAVALRLLSNAISWSIQTGDWTWALGELRIALSEDLEASDRVQMLGAGIWVNALRGESTTDDLAEWDRLVGPDPDPSVQAMKLSVMADVAFADGRLEDARTLGDRQIAVQPSSVVDAAARSARSALWLRDAPAARSDLDALESSGIHGRTIDGERTAIRAGIMALEGRSDEALTTYRSVLIEWRDLGLTWNQAICGLDMAQLLDPADPDVRAAAATSREIFERLGATPFRDRLEAAIASSRPAPSSQPVPVGDAS